MATLGNETWSKGIALPLIGFAEDVRAFEAAEREARKRPPATNYPWPSMEASRRIHAPQAGPGWRRFHDKLEQRAHKIGEVVGVSALSCQMIDEQDFNDLMTDKYVRASREPDDRGRKTIARDVARTLNGIISHMHDEQVSAELNLSFAESPDLRQRVSDEDLVVDAVHPYAPSVQPNLWSAGLFEVASVESSGFRDVTLALDDPEDIVRRSRHELLSVMRTRLGLDTTIVDVDNWEPVVTVLTTHAQVPVNKLDLRIPALPLDIPLKAPRIYVEDGR